MTGEEFDSLLLYISIERIDLFSIRSDAVLLIQLQLWERLVRQTPTIAPVKANGAILTNSHSNA